MPGPNAYATAGALRRALEDRVKRIAHEEKVDVNRLRRQVAFDRLLARLFLPDQAWVSKGGYALELLFDTARATIDIDLTLPGSGRHQRANERCHSRNASKGRRSVAR